MKTCAGLLLLTLVPAAQQDSVHRQFDFWVGEWSVQNRHLVADGTWKDGDVTRARITPVCGDRAVLEEWAGDFSGNFMNGFSLRAFDPDLGRWMLLLSWTTDGNSTFGRLSGSFRHGRGEFFTNLQGANRTRYTFSDALPNTVRWDSSVTSDGGRTWGTNWIMEFTRTRAAVEVDQDELFATAWTEGIVSPHEAARGLDGMVGTWRGTATDDAGRELDARLRCKLLNKGCLVVDVLEVWEPGESDPHERLTVRGWIPGRGVWEAWTLSEEDTRLRASSGQLDGDAILFEGSPNTEGAASQEAIVFLDDDELRIEDLVTNAGDVASARTLVLERVDG